MEEFHYLFQNTGETEYNDVVYDHVFDLSNNEFTFLIKPQNTIYWRFGIRLSATPEIEFYHPSGRYQKKDTADVHIAAGEWNGQVWILPNRFQMAQYYLPNQEHILSRFEKYEPFQPVEWQLRFLVNRGEGNVLLLGYKIGNDVFSQQYAIAENYKYFKVFAWADKSNFSLDCTISQRSFGPFSIGNITFRNGDMFDDLVMDETDIILLPASSQGTATKNILARSEELGIPPPVENDISSVLTYEVTTAYQKRLRAGYAYSVKNNESSIEIIKTLCKSIISTFSKESAQRINIPLFGTGGGSLSPEAVAVIYLDVLNNDTVNLKFIVSIVDDSVFIKVKNALGNFNTPINKNAPDVKSRLHSDTFSIDEADVLNYDLIAENFFTILSDKETNPPLNVGIIAPWGRGKTNLMKRLKNKFDEERTKLLSNSPTVNKMPSIKTLGRWINNEAPILGVKHNIPYSTVWFNPWNYQSTDMIWAGLADAIIEQVVESIPGKIDQEIFWFQLRLARIDKQELRRDVQTRFVYFISNFIIWILVGIVAIAYFILSKPVIAWGVIGVGGIIGTITSIMNFLKPYRTNISKAFDKYTKPPKYPEKLGTFHDVQTDVNRVLDLCIDKRKPLVIFVDDLDRCSASKVVEVIEAINVFINGMYNNKCYFVLGMDAEMVAAALDASYEKMKGRLGNKEMEQGSIGWYFMDKFIQLPFFIPVMSEAKKGEYLDILIKEKNYNTEQQNQIDTGKVKDLFEGIMSTNSNVASSNMIAQSGLTIEEKNALDKMILKNQVESRGQEEEIKKQVLSYGRFLNSDPRSLKRFTNLLRFYCGYQFLRMKKGEDFAEAKVLAKWLVVMIKFPQLVRWIQWDADNKTGPIISSENKATILDSLIKNFMQNNNGSGKTYKDWLQLSLPITFYQTEKRKKIDDLDEITWIKSETMFEILMFEFSEKHYFKNAFVCNVW